MKIPNFDYDIKIESKSEPDKNNFNDETEYIISIKFYKYAKGIYYISVNHNDKTIKIGIILIHTLFYNKIYKTYYNENYIKKFKHEEELKEIYYNPSIASMYRMWSTKSIKVKVMIKNIIGCVDDYVYI